MGKFLALILCGYVLAAALLLPHTRWQLNADGVAYLDNAKTLRVSSHWSPLLSWLIAPLIRAGAGELLAARLVMYAAGAAAIVAMWLLSTKNALVTAAFVPAVVVWSSTEITPDVLLLALILFYLWLVPRSRAGAGLAGGLAYLAKSYALPFFVVHYAIAKRRDCVPGFCAFAVVALPWIITIRGVGTAGAYNWTPHPPIEQLGLVPPPDARATSAWDDPSKIRPLPAPVPVVRRVGENIVALARILTSWSILAIPLIAWALYERVALYEIGTAALFAGGFLPLLVLPRYLYVVYALLLIVAGNSALKRAASLVVIASFVIPMILPRRFDQNGRVTPDPALRGKRFASTCCWHQSLYLAWASGAQYYGVVRDPRDVQRYGIDLILGEDRVKRQDDRHRREHDDR